MLERAVHPAPKPEPVVGPIDDFLKKRADAAETEKDWYFVRTGVFACRICHHETSNRYIREHVDGHRKGDVRAAREANGEHVHRWLLSTPKDGVVHETCKGCGIERDTVEDGVHPNYSVRSNR
jgi:hypothetical protein